MAWNDPVIWVLILVVVMLLFGATRIPKFARSLGEARKEFNEGMKGSGGPSDSTSQTAVSPPSPNPQPYKSSVSSEGNDPLILAAQKEGIDTKGKSRHEIAAELSLKLSRS